MKLNVGNNTVRNAFTDPANMSRWVQNVEAVDKDHTRRTPWFRFMFTGSKELISALQAGTFTSEPGTMQRFKFMVEPGLVGENA